MAGFSGEQFALPEAIPVLRDVRRRSHDASLVCISGVDPLNLCDTLLPGDKVPALAGNRILFRDGIPVATILERREQVYREARSRNPRRWTQQTRN